MITGTCILCFSINIKLFDIYNSHLQYAFEKISGFVVSNTYKVCSVCCTRLRQLYFLIKQIESLELSDSRNHQVYAHTQLTSVNVENASIPYHTRIKQEAEIQVKEEKLSDKEDEIDIGFEDIPNILSCLQTVDIIKIKKQPNRSKTKKKTEYCCDICSRKYTRKSSLTSHKKTHTKGPFVCHICGVRLTLKNNLKTHMMIHSNEKPFPCDKCNKSFKRSDHLKLHKITHSNEKPFFCDVCGMKFRRKTTLQDHKHNIHIGDKVFVCDICKKKFNRKGNLKAHIMGHTDQKPYKCSACKRSYVANKTLKLHIKKHCPYIKLKV